MSRRKHRTRTPVLERAAGYTGPMGIQGNFSSYAGSSVTIPVQVLAQMLQNLAPQKNQAKDFAPGSPLRPYEGVVPQGGPRQWSYPVGYNIHANDRTLGIPDVPTFQQLRNLAMLYSGITLCERVILDMIPKLEPQVKLKKKLVEAGADENAYTGAITRWMAFLEMPSPGQRLDIHSWLRMAWTEQTQVDALCLFKHNTKGKHLFGLEIVSGDSIKPLLDERGMQPQPPFPAFQQYPYGVPGDQYTLEQMLYYRESPRANTPYGFSRIERIILEVNQALRKKNKDLARFTEGNLPSGIMEVPNTALWTPDQIDAYEQAWNGLLAGNVQQQVRVKFMQPGMKYTPILDYTGSQQMTEFDQFLLNVTLGCYGLSMGDIGFTEDIHKSSGDSQQNMMFRRTLAPLISIYARMLTNLLCEAFGDDELEVHFSGFEEPEDLNQLASAYGSLVQNGLISPADAAHILKLPDVPQTGPFILSKGGQPLFLDNLADHAYRKAQFDAQMVGLKLAANGPPQAAPQGEEASSDENAGNSEMDEGDEEADEALSDLQRFDPVHAYHGEFGYYTSGTKKVGAKKTGTVKSKTPKKKGPKLSKRDRYVVRMGKYATRFEKLSNKKSGKKWSAAQASAAGKLSGIFEQLARSIEGGNQARTDGLFDQASAQARIVFGNNPKGMNAMVRALTLMDNANDKGIRVAIGEYDDEDDTDENEEAAFSNLDDELDEMGGDEDEEEVDDPASRANQEDDVKRLLAAVEELLRRERAKERELIDVTRPYQDTQDEAGTTSRDAASDGAGNSEVAAARAGEDACCPGAQGTDRDRATSAEYRHWRERAIKDVREGKAFRGFTTTLIPEATHDRITRALEQCVNADEVKAVFSRAQTVQEQDSQIAGASPQLDYDTDSKIWEPENVEAQLDALRKQGTYLVWHAHSSPSGVCLICAPNDGVMRKIGEAFPSGAKLPQLHPNCQCTVEVIKEPLGTITGGAVK